jgi:hypothetical protein
VVVYKHHPKRAKYCVFCKFWIGDANMRLVNSAVGFEYNGSAKGKCTKRNGAITQSCYSCREYAPSVDAEKLL